MTRTIRKLLLVDDDAVLIRSYGGRLSAHGFQVSTATSGSAAIRLLQVAEPDVVVLDLMMPDCSGVDVLRFIRSQPRLAAIPVVVLANAYMNDLGRQAATIGIQKALLKAQCNPSVLMACVDEILEGKPTPTEPAQIPPVPSTPPPAPPARRPRTADGTGRETPSAARPTEVTAPATQPVHAVGASSRPVEKGVARTKPGTDLLSHGSSICADLRKLFQAAAQQARSASERQMRVQDLYRKVHFLAAAAGLTEYAKLTQTALVFEALLYVLMEDPSRLSPSVLRTLASLVDFVEILFRRADDSLLGGSLSGQVLVVDDDPLSNRLVVSALRQAQLNARSTEDALVAWQWANREHFDLILLDIEMPVLDGFELCKRLRAAPAYEHTPIIFVTIHGDFESRAKSSLSGGDDLIAKPILPMELAAKVVMHLLRRQMPA